MIERYSRRTGFDVSDADWYQSFAFFKLAVVCQGIAARATGGAMVGSGFDDAQRLVAPLVDAGRYVLGTRAAALSGARTIDQWAVGARPVESPAQRESSG